MAENGRKLRPDLMPTMAETPEIPEIPAVPAETPPADAASPGPEPSGTSLGGADEAEVINRTSLLDSGSPAVLGSYATVASSTFDEAPAPGEAASAPGEAASAVFVAGYGSAAQADLLPEQPDRKSVV